jgi:hypothetical protein
VKRGPKPGYKQTPEHIAKRIRRGSEHHAWKGDAVTPKGGRTRALRYYKDIGPCSACGAQHAERHHKDGDTANNEPDNIAILCRKCHMEADGRMEEFRDLAITNQPAAVAARWGKTVLRES